MPALIPNAASAGAPLASAMVTTPSSLPAICHTTLSDDLSAAANIQYARCEPRAASMATQDACETLLPQQAPVELQMLGGTIMHLHSEPDRVDFLKRYRPNALLVEMLDAVRSVNECPTSRPSREVTSDIESRMACLGVGAVAAQPSNMSSSLASPVSLDKDAGDVTASAETTSEAGIPVSTSEFDLIETLSLPSVYIRQEGYEPGTLAALEYDLGWRTLSPTWAQVMPVIDEAKWQADPNPVLFRAVGRAVLPYLATDSEGYLLDEICARIASFHMHAGGVVDCLSNFTRTVERVDADGQPKTVAAIELTDLVHQCSGKRWREALVAPEGQDALTRRREACAPPTTSTPTPRQSGEETQVRGI